MCFSVKKTNKQYLIEFVFLIAKTTQNEKLWSYISSMLLWSTGTGCARSSARHSLQGKSWKVIQNSEELIFSSHLLLMALEVKTLPPLSEPQSMTGSYLLPVCFSWTTSILTIQLSIFGGVFCILWCLETRPVSLNTGCTDFLCVGCVASPVDSFLCPISKWMPL